MVRPQPLGMVIATMAAVLVGAAGMIAVAIAAWQTCGFARCPDLGRLLAYQPGHASMLVDRHGTKFAELARSQRPPVPLAALPPYVPTAFVAAQDRRFYAHRGIDWRQAASALLPTAISSGRPIGTIPMQLARDVFRADSDAHGRVTQLVHDMRAAEEIERRYSKDEILELYLNTVRFGTGVNGIEAAARRYFAKPAAELTLPQAALLATVAGARRLRTPDRSDELTARRNRVLDAMARDRWITPADADAAKRTPATLTAVEAEQREPTFAPYFVEQVRRELEDRFGDSIYDEPVRVWTTLDPAVQSIAGEELNHQLRAIEDGAAGAFVGRRYVPSQTSIGDVTPYLQGSVVVIDPRNGDVLAWVGGRDFTHSQFDRVGRARRQAGSAFAPFVYAAALERGVTLAQPVRDEPLRLELDGGRVWEARNVDEHYAGTVALREALAAAKDAPTAQLAGTIGYQSAVDVARRAGISEPIRETPPTAIGNVTVSLLELTAAYTVFAGLGRRVEPRLVLRVEHADGSPLWTAAAESSLVLDPKVAFLMNDVLRDELNRLQGAALPDARLRGRAAGRTGSTQNATDAWFIGYLPDLIGGVWIGFDRPQAISSHNGAQLVAPVWARMARRIYATRPLPETWPRPDSIVLHRVDAATGVPLAPGCRLSAGRVHTEYFIEGTEPAPACPATRPAPSAVAVVSVTAPPRPGAEAPAELAVRGEQRPNESSHAGGPSVAPAPSRGDALALHESPGIAPAGDLAAPSSLPHHGGDVSGEWELVNEIAETSYHPYRGLRLGFRVRLWQDGERVRGVGKKWSENGHPLPAAQRTPLHLDGTIDHDSLTLLFTEQGRRRDTSGILRMRVAESSDRLSGSFASTAAETSGTTVARRLP